MHAHERSGCWYIDVRPDDSSEQVSLDLTQHLPRRLTVGKSLVVTTDPKKLLPVIRKRWMALLSMIEHQYASTLDHIKKDGLRREMERMRTFRFSRDRPEDDPTAAIYLLTMSNVSWTLTPFKTIYIMYPLTRQEFASVVDLLIPGGLVVLYGTWNAEYEEVMHDLVRAHTKNKGSDKGLDPE